MSQRLSTRESSQETGSEKLCATEPSPVLFNPQEPTEQDIDYWTPGPLKSELSLDSWTTESQNESGIYEEINSYWYKVGKLLGKGGYGAIYAATLLTTNQKVALKYVQKRPKDVVVILPDYPNPVPLEVALMMYVNLDSGTSNIIQMFDWKDCGDQFVMVLERPSPCMDLWEFANSNGGCINEETSRIIMRQVIQAACTCCQKQVFHRDIKLENLLINTETYEVKLIDFGCGDFIKSSAFNHYKGTRMYAPPEYIYLKEYHAKPATVYSIGMVLFHLVCSEHLTRQDQYQVDCNLWSMYWLSAECCHFICGCLQSNPARRFTLEELLLQPWFNIGNCKPAEISPRRVQTDPYTPEAEAPSRKLNVWLHLDLQSELLVLSCVCYAACVAAAHIPGLTFVSRVGPLLLSWI